MTVRIERHDTSDVVQLTDGSRWRIFPADVPVTLGWSSSTEFDISTADDELWSHVLVSRGDNSRVRVISVSENWPRHKLRQSLRDE
jgi:hypothetical protein